MSKFPFISNFEGTEYEKETKNRIEKVRAFYENRELYDITIKKHPEQRLASDIDKDGYDDLLMGGVGELIGLNNGIVTLLYGEEAGREGMALPPLAPGVWRAGCPDDRPAAVQ